MRKAGTMKREADEMKEITDGRLYGSRDLVRVGCHDCEGCSTCCHDVEGLFLTPLDMYRITRGLGRPFEDFLEQEIELTLCDGVILPKMKMQGQEPDHPVPREQMPACGFLTAEGRCGIHSFRPDICRLYPLGRYYEADGFRYFLQIHECERPHRYKVQVQEWLGEENPEENRRFLLTWHAFVKGVGESVPKLTDDSRKQVLLYILRLFYMKPWEDDGFYPQFAARMERAQSVLAPLMNH